ncbi:M14 family zinc carboxypeptidase [Comamonas odontotermitis]|uniref:M14 family zinc carboxypeptidase n=1 Tax=Comamonas odontotermitis TaxID=379895 RepID=UPI00375249FE
MALQHRTVRSIQRVTVLMAALMACNLVSAHGDSLDADQVYSIVIPYSSGADYRAITRILDHVYMDQDARTASAEVSASELAQLKAQGLQVQINEAETKRIQGFLAESNTPSTKSITNGTHSCYRTVGQVYKNFEELAAKYPKYVRVKTLGKSWSGMKYQGADAPDESTSTWAKLLAKYLPASFIEKLDLKLFPDEPYPIKVLVVGNFEKQDAQTEKPPNMVWTGGIHAREYAPQEVGMKYLEWLLANYETDANAHMMLDTNRYHFIVHNPDGRSIAEQQGSATQRKNTNYETAACTKAADRSGVDLNRNYPFGWRIGGPGGSDDQCSETFRGAAPVSEPETKVVLDYVRGTWNQAACRWEGGALPDGRPKSQAYCNEQNKDNGGAGEFDWKTGADESYGGGVFIDLHSFSRAILWSWGVIRSENDNNIQTPNNLGLATIAQRMAYHNHYNAQQVLGYDTEGTTKDAIYGYLGAPSYTLEMGRSFYESCTNFDKEVYPENFNGLHYLSRVLYRPYQLPQGPDTIDVNIAADEVTAGSMAAITALVDDNRYRYSKPGQPDIPAPPEPVIKRITSAMAYVDKLPWEAGAKGIPLELLASDKAQAGFESATKIASGNIDTTGLAAGRHLVYVQGTTENGQVGSVSAAFLNIKAAPVEEDVVLIDTPLTSSEAGVPGIKLNVTSTAQCTGVLSSLGAAPRELLPAGMGAATGLVSFTLSNCSKAGLTAKVTLTLPSAVPPGAKLLKITKNPDGQKTAVEIASATIAGNTVSYLITDGDALDEDGQVNAAIVDPVVVAAPAAVLPGTPASIPANQPLALLLASALIGWIVVQIQRRRSLGASASDRKA